MGKIRTTGSDAGPIALAVALHPSSGLVSLHLPALASSFSTDDDDDELVVAESCSCTNSARSSTKSASTNGAAASRIKK